MNLNINSLFLKKKLFFLSCILSIVAFSCNKFSWYNPFDPECPKSLFTPSSLNAEMQGNNTRLIWEQDNNNISGFQIYRAAEGESIIRLAQIEKEKREYVDSYVSPGKIYTYSIIAVAGNNPSDTVKKSFKAIFTTTVATQEVVELSPVSAKIKSSILSSGGDSVISRGICWSKSINPTINENRTRDGAGIGQFISTIDGLLPDTKYYVRAYGENSRGVSYGQELNFTTQGPPKVNTRTITDITTTSASVGSHITSDGGIAVTQRGVVFSTAPNPILDSSKAVISGTGIGSYTSSITGLQPSTIYYVRAFATNSFGTSYGDQLTFTTLTAAAVLNTSIVINITANSAESGGAILDDRGISITAKGICWSKFPNPTVADSKTVDGQGNTSFKSIISGLEPNTVYYVRAYVQNQYVTSYGNELSFNSTLFLNGAGVTDIDGNKYKTVIIGAQEWMAENLRVARYQNGDIIEEINLIDQWKNSAGSFNKPLKGVVNGDQNNLAQYGYIYNVRAMKDIRGVCPTDYHVPTLAEWKELEVLIGIDKAAFRMKSKSGWSKGITLNGIAFDYNGDNLSGLNILPGGWREYTGDASGDITSFWSSSLPLSPTGFSNFPTVGESIYLTETNLKISTYSSNDFSGLRIRCLKNK